MHSYVLRKTVETPHGPRINGNWMAFHVRARAVLIDGPRGTGKSTTALLRLVSFATRHGGSKIGVFRASYPALDPLFRQLSKMLEPLGCKTVRSPVMQITLSNGSMVTFRSLSDQRQWNAIQGAEFDAALVDEVGLLASDRPLAAVIACLRGSRNIERWLLLTTNPSGTDGRSMVAAGAGIVKRLFIDGKRPFEAYPFLGVQVFGEDGSGETLSQVRCRTTINDNPALLKADPYYQKVLDQMLAEQGSVALRNSWIRGSWDDTDIGWLQSAWSESAHTFPEIFPYPGIPDGWPVYRCMDWGKSQAFAVQWWAVADGAPFRFPKHGGIGIYHPMKGDMFLVAEIDGADSRGEGLGLDHNELAGMIAGKERALRIHERVLPGPGDSVRENPRLAAALNAHGVPFAPVVKRRGSRSDGFRSVLSAIRKSVERPRKRPGAMFISRSCAGWIRTVPRLQRAAGKDDIEVGPAGIVKFDHPYDTTRYLAEFLSRSQSEAGVMV